MKEKVQQGLDFGNKAQWRDKIKNKIEPMLEFGHKVQRREKKK